MKKLWWLLLLISAIGLAVWYVDRKNDIPSVPFTRVRRETLVSTLSTNGKVEPFEWQSVRADLAGIVEKVLVQEGSAVAQGAILAQLSDPTLQPGIEAAAARVTEARAALETINTGGKPAELTDIENNLARAQFDRAEADRDYQSLKRLLEKQAATKVEVAAAAAKLKQSEIEIEGLEKRRAALASRSDRTVAEARLRDAEAALALARGRAGRIVLRAPIAGTVYQLTVRPGAYLSEGDPVANVGRLDRLHIRVYVDEPELGRVAVGQPVVISWDALPGKQWSGAVEKMPTSIQPLGTRQVGEVLCTIDNPGHELVPGTNVNAAIRTAVAQDALLLPKEVMRHDARGAFVLVLTDHTVVRRTVETGNSSITRVQVTSGLREGEAVALPTETPVKPGDRINPTFP